MKKLSQWMMAGAALSLLGLFLFPLWKITLEAPQFPDGLYMYIWINKISGSSEHILQNINILNHYIGMQPIEPDSIPELQYLPYIVTGMTALGLLFAFIGRPSLYLVWFVILVALGALGLYDFYLWGYDYGHNLDPKAPIKVPGMAYQPPLLGRKELLNFVAHSYPAAGSLFLLIGGLLSMLAFYFGRTKEPRSPAKKAVALPLLLLLLSACSTEPEPISFGKDQCVYCKMAIVDQQYGAELVTGKGKVYKFDAVECLVDYQEETPAPEGGYAHVLAIGYDTPGELHPVAEMHFLISPEIRSPMGANLAAFAERAGLDEMRASYNGEVYEWEGLKGYLRGKEWVE